MLPDFENSKINACVDNVYRIWEENKDKKSAQLVFCDLSTPKNDGTFSVYNDIRKKLIERGVPESEVRFIHEADTDVKKKELFQKTRKGEVWTGVASWKIMVSSVLGGLAIGYLGFAVGATDLPGYYQLVMGGFLFGTVFMATDPVTSAQTECGKWIYGFLVGALAVTVRIWNPGYPEGMQS